MKSAALLSVLALAACSQGVGSDIGPGDNHPAVCQAQSDAAAKGLRPSGEISISCPDHGIGPYRP